MRQFLRIAVVTCTTLLLTSGSALACHLEGRVVCEGLGLPVAGATITVTGGILGSPQTATTDSDGRYWMWGLGDVLPADFTATLTSVPEGTPVPPVTRSFHLQGENDVAVLDWQVSGVAACSGVPMGCWLTGGGAKFSPTAGLYVAEHGPKVNFGGNVNPSCSPIPGDGGQWTHVDHQRKLFFQGTQVMVDECGNVSGIPPGSTSPVTPYNYIEYSGTGRLRGIASNNPAGIPEVVCFEARAEDRNEPGSSGNRDGARVDRYYLRVFLCESPWTTLLSLGTQAEPVTITDGNLQLHVSSCP